MIDFETTIKELLIKENMSVSELSRLLNKSPQNIGNMLHKNNNPRLKTFEEILCVLGYELKIIKKV